jgi:hypothetical protein
MGARQGPPRVKQAEVAGQTFRPLPDTDELLGHDPDRTTTNGQGVQAGETFAGKRVQVSKEGVRMNRQCLCNLMPFQRLSEI